MRINDLIREVYGPDYLTPVRLRRDQIRPVKYNPNRPDNPGFEDLDDFVRNHPNPTQIFDLFQDLVDPQGGNPGIRNV